MRHVIIAASCLMVAACGQSGDKDPFADYEPGACWSSFCMMDQGVEDAARD